MKTIIDNKLYDTDKCKLITKYMEKVEHDELVKLYLYHHTYIYKTKSGKFLKQIGQVAESGWKHYNETLELVSDDFVKKLLIKLNQIDKYIETFGEVEEG